MLKTVDEVVGLADELADVVPSVDVWKLKFFSEEVDVILDIKVALDVTFLDVKLKVEVTVEEIAGFDVIVPTELLAAESRLDVV